MFNSKKYEKLSVVDPDTANEQDAQLQQEYIPRKMPDANMDDIELKNIDLQTPNVRSLSKQDSIDSQQEERVETDFGYVLVSVQGDRNKPAVLTFHDIGLNHTACFQAFFNFADTRVLMQHFCVYHVNAPGQEENAVNLPAGFVYPDMNQLSDSLIPIMKYFSIKRIIGFGVGAGANVLSRFALSYPDKVDALCLINATCSTASWSEWGYQKLNSMHLKSKGMTASTLDYLMWHHFGKGTEDRNHDLIQVYRKYFESQVNAYNLALFIDAYVRRSDLGLVRELDPIKKKLTKNIKCPVMIFAGSASPHLESTVEMNSKVDPTMSNWLKLSDCGMVLEEVPSKVCEAFRLFLQGLGYVSSSRKSSVASAAGSTVPPIQSYKTSNGSSRTTSVEDNCYDDDKNPFSAKKRVHIVENPIGQHSIVC